MLYNSFWLYFGLNTCKICQIYLTEQDRNGLVLSRLCWVTFSGFTTVIPVKKPPANLKCHCVKGKHTVGDNEQSSWNTVNVNTHIFYSWAFKMIILFFVNGFVLRSLRSTCSRMIYLFSLFQTCIHFTLTVFMCSCSYKIIKL